MAYYSGKDAAVTVNSVALAGTDWSVEVETTAVQTTSHLSPTVGSIKYREHIAGFTGWRASVKVIHDPTLALASDGAIVAFVGTIGGGHTVSGNILVKKRGFASTLEDATKVSIEGEGVGALTVS